MQLHLREGHLYKVDTRLRPSGNQGTLVVRQETFRDHHQRRGQIWERQSLIKARPLAGDLAMAGQLLANLIHPLVYQRPLPADAAAEIDRLRRRMEVEISKETAEDLDPNGGYGGAGGQRVSSSILPASVWWAGCSRSNEQDPE